MHLHTGERGEIMKIAVISDLHCSDTVITPANPPRHGIEEGPQFAILTALILSTLIFSISF